MMKTPSAWAIVILIIVVLLLFGASKLPDVAGSIGKSLKVFKKEVKELREDVDVPTGGEQPGGVQQASASPAQHAGTQPRQAPTRGPHGGEPDEGHNPPHF